MRGNHYAKIPDIASQPLNTPLPVPRDGVPHPLPYFVTQAVVLKLPADRPPWRLATKQGERELLDFWDSAEDFQANFIDHLIRDCLHEQITSICSSFLVGETTKVNADKKFLIWLQEEVIEPVVYDEVEKSVFEELWSHARMLTDSEFKSISRVYEDQEEEVEATFLTFLEDHSRAPPSPDQGKSIYSRRWGEVLYQLNKIISKASLMENFTIRKLHEYIVTQIASQVLFQESIRYVEEEMRHLDGAERVDVPPRTSAK